MKSKILTVAFALVLFSCATKTPPATPKQPAVVLTTELSEGKGLYENNCAKCHELFEPKKYTHEEWKPILVKMQKKARLDDTQMASISNYIDSQL